MLRLKREKGSPYWYVRGSVCGLRIYRSTGTTGKEEAEEFAHKLEADIYKARALGHKQPATWARAVNLYLDGGGEDRFLLPLLDLWRDTPLAEIDQELVDRAARDLYPKATPATRIRQVYSPVRAVLRKARKANLEGAPALELELPKVKKKPVQYANDAYLDRVLEAACPHMRAVLLIMTYTGLRTSEVLSRRPEDFAIEPGWLDVRKTKNSEPALVPLPPQAYEAAAAVEFRFKWSSSPALCHALRKVCEAAGVPYMKPHSIGRHAFAARLLREGYDIKLVKEAGRWKSIQVVDQNYGHLEKRHVHEVMRKVAKR